MSRYLYPADWEEAVEMARAIVAAATTEYPVGTVRTRSDLAAVTGFVLPDGYPLDWDVKPEDLAVVWGADPDDAMAVTVSVTLKPA